MAPQPAPDLNWGTAKRRLMPGWQVKDGDTVMFRPLPLDVPVTRYLYRGTEIPSPREGVLAETA